MSRVKGICLTFCTDEGDLWWDADSQYRSPEGKKGFGIMIALRWGKLLQPIGTKIFNNVWFRGDVLFTLRIPFVVLPYISIAIGKFGLYFGGKIYGVDRVEYLRWAYPDEIKKGNTALALSASIRRTRIV